MSAETSKSETYTIITPGGSIRVRETKHKVTISAPLDEYFVIPKKMKNWETYSEQVVEHLTSKYKSVIPLEAEVKSFVVNSAEEV